MNEKQDSSVLMILISIVAIIIVGGIIFLLTQDNDAENVDNDDTVNTDNDTESIVEDEDDNEIDFGDDTIDDVVDDPIGGEEIDYTLQAGNYFFAPNNIQVSPGETINVKILNSEDMLHDFVIDELNIQSIQLAIGEEDTVQITIPADAAVGTSYEFYCSLMNHRELGMVGTIQVI